jgi:RHS repeat-associated protein
MLNQHEFRNRLFSKAIALAVVVGAVMAPWQSALAQMGRNGQASSVATVSAKPGGAQEFVAPAADVTGVWYGNLKSPYDSVADAWTEEVTLTQDANGNVTGTRLTVPGGSGQKWFKTSVSGTVSGNTMTIADQAILEQGDPSSSPCLITLTMTLSADESTFSGPWTSPTCQGGSMTISHYGGQAAAALGSGAPCDGGTGSMKNGTGSGGGASGNADGSSCAEKLGAAHVGDPIDASTGNFFLQEDDFDSGDYLTFRRFYNSSQAMVPAHMGFHWRHSFDRSLVINGSPTTSVTALRPDGKQETFRPSGDGWIGTTPGDRFAVVKDAAGNVTGYSFFVGGVRQTEIYDTRGTLLSVTGQDGQGITLAYTTSSTPTVSGVLLTSVTDSKGRTITFAYDSHYRLRSLKFPDGTTASFDYNDSYARMYAAYGSQNIKYYSYNEKGSVGDGAPVNLLTSIYDVIGNYESVTYDSQGRATSSSFTGNVGATKVTYHDGAAPTITYPLGNTVTLGVSTVAGVGRVTYLDTPCGPDCGQRWKSRTYDSLGFPASMTDFRGNTTQMTYDANGLLVHTSEAVDTDAQRNTSTTWDTTLRLPLTRAVSNAKGNVVVKSDWAYNARGQVTAECVIDPSVSVNYACGSQAHAPKGIRQTLHTWCDAVNATTCPLVGLPLTIDGPRTDITDVRSFAYYMTTDESGCNVYGGPCHKMGDVSTITDEAGHVMTFVTYNGGGRPTRIKDANGVITDLAYNAGGQLASRIVRVSADGTSSSGDATTTLTYGYRRLLQQVTDPDGVTLNLQYDLANRLTNVSRADRSFIRYTLDAAGNPTKEEAFDSSNTLRRSMSRAYNALGQLVSVTDGLGQVVFDATATGSYDADGNFVGAKDARGTSIRNSYDGLNRLVSSVGDFNGTSASTAHTQLATAFDALDNVSGISDPAAFNTLYDRNGFGDLLGVNSPDTGATAFTVDAAGNRLTKTDAKGVMTTYTYDALGRVTSASFADASLSVAYHYDEANLVTGCSASAPIGRVTRMVETGVTTSYCYDGRGNVTDKRQTQGTVTDAIHYVYTKADRIQSETRPGGAVVAYGRDSLGQVTGVAYTPTPGGSALTVASSIKWLPFGPVQQYVLGNNQSVVRTYDANYRVTDVVSPALEMHFVLDAVGNVTGVSESGGGAASYVYDALNRLTTVKDGSGKVIEAYIYNQTGDRLSKTAPGSYTGAYKYKAGTHWLTNMGTASRTYDANGSTTGNVSAGTTTTYVYNGRGRMTSVQVAGATVGTYAYNALNERVAKTVGSTTTRFVYDNGSRLVSEASGSTRRDYVSFGGIPLAVFDNGSVTSVGFVTADGLGTPRAVSSGTGAVIWNLPYSLNPFSEHRATSNSGYVFNLRLPGQYADGEAGVKYNLNRTFDAATGRYLESDPIGLAGGASTYSYTRSNPLTGTDPTGLDTVLLVNTRTVELMSGYYGGHAAVAVGDDNHGWTFYQEGGVENGVQMTTTLRFATLQDLEASLTSYTNRLGAPMTISQAYDKQQGYRTKPLQDILMNTWARYHINDSYSATRNNCGDYAANVLRAGGLHPTANAVGPTIPVDMRISNNNDPGRFSPRAN